MPHTRRTFLRNATLASLATTLPLHAQALTPFNTASAGSLRAILEGDLKTAAAQSLHLDLHEHAGGADSVAHEILSKTITPDAFLSVTASPMLSILKAGLASSATPIARSELVFLYSPKSRFAPELSQASSSPEALFKALQLPGLKIGRGNPEADPGARCILFAFLLFECHYNQPGLLQKVLGHPLNPAQIVPDVATKLKSGDLDLTATYKMNAVASGLPYISLPPQTNLSQENVATLNPTVSLSLNGKTYLPEPVIFYAAALTPAAAPFIPWLTTPATQALFAKNHFEAPGSLPPLKP